MNNLRTSHLLAVIAVLAHAGAHAQTGNALYLDGSGDYMSVADHDDIDLQTGESFSITCWARTTQSVEAYRLIAKRGDSQTTFPGYEMINSVGAGAFGINLRSTAGTNAGPPYGTTSITDGAWHHLAMVVDAAAGTAKIHVDGTLEQTSTSAAIGTEAFDNSYDLLVDAAATMSAFWNGSVDEVRVWSVALSDAAVSTDMTMIVTGSEPGLIAAWNFDDVVGQSVPDLTGSHPGTLHGDAICLDANGTDMVLSGTTFYHPDLPTGRGEANERLMSVNLVTTGSANPLVIADPLFVLDPSADASALQTFRLFANGSAARLDLGTAQLLGEAFAIGGQVQFTLQDTLAEGDNVFWLCADVGANATEGSQVAARLQSYSLSGISTQPTPASTVPLRTVLLEHKLLFSAGDYNSAAYRIPAIANKDGHLTVAIDKRIDDNGDLPGNIDIVVRNSTDNGVTWSAPITVADFGSNGASDPALVYDQGTGDLLCLFASHNGLFASTPGNKIRFQVARSSDYGATWNTPQEFSSDIYQAGWYAAWVASGSAHQTPSGRIVAAIAARQNSGNTLSNFMIYSDDGGLSWATAPGQASPVGDEAKIVSLDDGRLMMLIRAAGQRKKTYSDDQGVTWTPVVNEPELVEPAVNGDLIRYTSVNAGYDTSRLLFSIASHPTQRRNLSVFVSYDEGETWGTSRVVCPGLAAYSAMTVLDDGTIGMFYENGEYENYQMNYARFSLDWISDGADTWTPAVGITEGPTLDHGFMVSPNPTSGAIIIQLDQALNSTERIDLLDVSGKLLDTIAAPGQYTGELRITWNRRAQASGAYLIRLQGKSGSATRRVSLY